MDEEAKHVSTKEDSMAKLTAKTRNNIPGKDFAVAGRKYPIEDRAHAENALARSSGKSVAGEVRAKGIERGAKLDKWAAGERRKPS